ncbi:Uma2 family endonuclease [Kitasatospora acidiphila]|uniref:Uma2 family endonuclease n=1 Tax=Kitasatospora acidiphila TaxID=2567942 RepID=A0A540WAM6_9ACTN|nr:Uma2 family endonuclease [Kitasatospora acidiphila]TQF05454.1 Uma2 family endonuclease [Kitasatospora acidiphila]
MTAVDDRMTGIFENLEVPEGLKAELLRGEIVMMAGPDLVHNLIVAEIQRQVPYARWRAIGTQDLSFPGDGSEPQPDLVVFERGAVEEHGRLLPAPLVTLVVEVVSKTSVHRDYRVKRELYAEGGIAAYLIVDPLKGECLLLTGPTGAAAGGIPDYLNEQPSKFGDPLVVDVLDLTLDTSEFRTYS